MAGIIQIDFKTPKQQSEERRAFWNSLMELQTDSRREQSRTGWDLRGPVPNGWICVVGLPCEDCGELCVWVRGDWNKCHNACFEDFEK